MAKQYLQRTIIRVEGTNDLHTIAVLLQLHAFQMEKLPRDVEIEEKKGKAPLLDTIGTAIKASTGQAVGFVIDADTDVSATWAAVRLQIEGAIGKTPKLPKECPRKGSVIDIADLKSRVGVWIWPDNTNPGILEDFLQGLVTASDPVLPIAESATNDAKKAGARFKSAYHRKAVVHAWLAWQKEPGRPFGVALKAKYFDHNAPFATAFVGWVRRLVD